MAVDLSFFRSETSQRLRAEGRAAGQAEGQAQALLLLLETRGIALTDEARRRITTCQDLDLLKTWFSRAVTAETADDVFAGD